jgi:hypothetical protein
VLKITLIFFTCFEDSKVSFNALRENFWALLIDSIIIKKKKKKGFWNTSGDISATRGATAAAPPNLLMLRTCRHKRHTHTTEKQINKRGSNRQWNSSFRNPSINLNKLSLTSQKTLKQYVNPKGNPSHLLNKPQYRINKRRERERENPLLWLEAGGILRSLWSHPALKPCLSVIPKPQIINFSHSLILSYHLYYLTNQNNPSQIRQALNFQLIYMIAQPSRVREQLIKYHWEVTDQDPHHFNWNKDYSFHWPD